MTSDIMSRKHTIEMLSQAEEVQAGFDLTENTSLSVEEMLEQERQLYYDLANAQPTGVYRLRIINTARFAEDMWRSSDTPPYKVEFANALFGELLDVNLETYQKNPAIINDLIFEDDKESFIQRNIECDRDLKPFIWEGRLLIRGQIVWYHFESTPRLLSNGDVIWTGVLYDITKRKKEQEEIQEKNEQLQILNAEKDKFFSILAHDLKSPFNSIVGYSQLLLCEVRENNLDEIEKYADIVLESSNTALALLSNLMDWARTQTGRLIFKPEFFDMHELIKNQSDVFFHIAEEKNISINVEIDSALPMSGDISMLSTVLRNLISNAIKFTHRNGKVTIRAARIDDKVQVSVSDNGLGMSEMAMSKLFRIDKKYSTHGTEGEEGTGLGLILCKDFIEKHGGHIWAESTENSGSDFIFIIRRES